MNPYDFVPIVEDKPPQRSLPNGHNLFIGKSGFLECTIKTLKPIFIPQPMDDNEREKKGLRIKSGVNKDGKMQYHNKYVFNTVNRVPLIPGSSIKGLIRTVAESAANSCLTFFEKDKNKNYRSYKSKKPEVGTIKSEYALPDDFYPCVDINNLCITCRLFGFQSSKGLFQGKVSISDAKAKTGYTVGNCIILTELSSPKPHHEAFYALFSDPDKIAGRKFYFHHRVEAPILVSSMQKLRNSSVRPIENAVFDFKITFTNLTEDEYALLLYSLFLEDNVCHKIGYGKPAGLGSVKIYISKLTLFNIENRYKGYTTNDRKEKSGEELKTHLKDVTKSYREDKSINLEALRKIWKWPGAYDIHYPDLDWFSMNSDASISKTHKIELEAQKE